MSRYERQIRFAPFGKHGQTALSHAQILIMGAGALGSHVAAQLARMGARNLYIVDMDIIETSNLHRQSLYTEEDADNMLPKVEAIKQHIQHINSEVNVTTFYQEVESSTIEALLTSVQPDIVIDGMDHFKIRYLINEVCHKYQIPWVYGAAVGSKGTVYGIDFKGPCLKCLLQYIPETGESCAINGVLPPIISQVASYEVMEAVRYLIGVGFSKQLITLDVFNVSYKAMNVDVLQDDNCQVCVQGYYEILETKQQTHIENLCGKTYLFRFQTHAFDYAHHFSGHIIKETPFAKLIHYQNYRMTLFQDGRMNVYGVTNNEEAQQLYHQFLKALK